MNAWFETDPGSRFRLHVVSTTGAIENGTLRIVLDDWPPYVDPEPWKAEDHPIAASGGKTGWSVQRPIEPKKLIWVEDENMSLGCLIQNKDGDQVSLYVRTIHFTS